MSCLFLSIKNPDLEFILKCEVFFFFGKNERNNSQVSRLNSVSTRFLEENWELKTQKVKERGLSSRRPIQHGGYGELILWD